MASKTLAVRGGSKAGKKTLIGRLVYSCGLGLEQLRSLERSNRTSYPDVVRLFEEKGEKPSFSAPAGKISIEDSGTPDILFWVVDATNADRGRGSSTDLTALLGEHKWNPKERLVVVVNKMDAVDWSEPVFAEIAQTFRNLDLKEHEVAVIPISALGGINILESSNGLSWAGATLVQTLG